jgi:hypothetical protein
VDLRGTLSPYAVAVDLDADFSSFDTDYESSDGDRSKSSDPESLNDEQKGDGSDQESEVRLHSSLEERGERVRQEAGEKSGEEEMGWDAVDDPMFWVCWSEKKRRTWEFSALTFSSHAPSAADRPKIPFSSPVAPLLPRPVPPSPPITLSSPSSLDLSLVSPIAVRQRPQRTPSLISATASPPPPPLKPLKKR